MSSLGEKFAGNVLALGAGSLTAKNGKSASLEPLDSNQVAKACQLIVLEIPMKACAEQQGSTIRAVQSQRQGGSAMTLRGAANLSRRNARAKAHFARLFGFTGPCTDPDFMEGIEKVADYYWRKQQPALIDITPAPDPNQADLFGGDKC